VNDLQQLAAALVASAKPAASPVLSGLSEPQLRFIRDPSKSKCALTTRQAGKTEAALAYLTSTCLNRPNTTCVYINRSLKQGKATVWLRFRQFFRRHGINARWHGQDQTFTFDNESVLYISGAKDVDECDRFRGLICSMVLLDECQSFRPAILTYLMNEVLDACLFKHNGTLVLCGTPNVQCNGFFFEVTREDSQYSGWSTTRWSWADNPGIPNKEQYIKAVLDKHKWKGDEPEYQSEWMGKWTKDTRSLLFEAFRPIVNEFQELPKGPTWRYTLGCDVGATRDLSAFVLIAWSVQTPTAYVISAEGVPGRDVTGYCQQVQSYWRKIPGLTVIMDDGALGAGYLRELQNRYKIPALGKTKTAGYKAGMVRIINDQFRLEKISLSARGCGALRENLQSVRFDLKTQIEHKDDPCDYADAFLYAYSHVYSFLHVPDPIPPTVEEKHRQEEQERYERTVKQFRTDEEVMEDEMFEGLTEELPDWPEP